MKPTMCDDLLAKALVDPASVFSSPMAVVYQGSLSSERKIEILRCWEYHAREMQVGDGEGFSGSETATVNTK